MRGTLLAAACVLFAGSTAASDRVPPPLERTAVCMLQVLEATPGVHNAKLGISTSAGWAHPFLEYEPDEEVRWEQPTRFEALRSSEHGPYSFEAVMPGIFTPGKPLDLHVTEEVIRRWKVQCGAETDLLFE
jgi:hypothetical protein